MVGRVYEWRAQISMKIMKRPSWGKEEKITNQSVDNGMLQRSDEVISCVQEF